MIFCNSVTKKYPGGKGIIALSEFTAVFPSRGLVFVTGNTGAGKSTLLHLISGRLKPTNGNVVFKPHKPKVALCYQTENLIGGLSAAENLLLFSKHKKSDWDRALHCFGLVGLNKELFARKCEELSSIDQQRVAIARALYTDASILLCDEPAALLIKEEREQLYDLLKELSKDRLVVIATRDRMRGKNGADLILELADGKLNSSPLLKDDADTFIETGSKRKLGVGAPTKLFFKHAVKQPFASSFPLLLSAVMLAGFSFTAGFAGGRSDADVAKSVIGSGIANVLYQKEKDHHKDSTGMGFGLSWGYEDQEKGSLEEAIGLPAVPVYGLPDGDFLGSFPSATKTEPFLYNRHLSSSGVYWALPATESSLAALGLSLYAGRLPASTDELALPLWQFQELSHRQNDTFPVTDAKNEESAVEEYLSKEPRIEVVGAFRKVVGVIDTKIDPSIYGSFVNETNPWLYSAGEPFQRWVASKSLHSCFYVSADFPAVLSSALNEVESIGSGEAALFYEGERKALNGFENTSSKNKRARPIAYFNPKDDGVCVTSDVLRAMYKDVVFDFKYYDATGMSMLNLPKLCDLPTETKVSGRKLFGAINTQEDWCHDAFVFSACCEFCQSNWTEEFAEKMTMVVTNFYKANQFTPIDFSLPENEEKLKLASAILLSSDGLSIRRTGEDSYYADLSDGGAFYENNRIPLEISGKDIAIAAFERLARDNPIEAKPVSITLETSEGRHEVNLDVKGYCIYPTNDKSRASIAFDFALPEYESLCVHFPKGRTTVAFASKTPGLLTLEKLARHYDLENIGGLATYAQIPQFLLRSIQNSEESAQRTRNGFLVFSIIGGAGFIAMLFLSLARLDGKSRLVGLLSNSGYRLRHIFLFVGTPSLVCSAIGLLLGSIATAVGFTVANNAFLSSNGLGVPLLNFPFVIGLSVGFACVVLTAIIGIVSSLVNTKRGNVHYLTMKAKTRDARESEIGEIVKALRTESQTSQAQLAEALSVSRTLVAKWESGKAPINEIYERGIWEFFKVSPPKMPSQTIAPIDTESFSDSIKIRVGSFAVIFAFSLALLVFAITRIANPLVVASSYDVMLLVLSVLAALFSLGQILVLLLARERHRA